MSDGATLYHEELLDLERQLDSVLASNNGHPTADQLTKAQTTLKRLNKLLQQLRIEVRLLDDPSVQKAFEGHAQAHTQNVASLKSSLQQAAAATLPEAISARSSAAGNAEGSNSDANGADTKNQVPPLAPTSGGGSKPSYSLWNPQESRGNGVESIGNDGKGEARQAAQRIQAMQMGTIQSLTNTEKLLNETETVGNEAATTLRKQTEQIQQTNQELDEMHSEVERAGKELKSFMRRMARDRIITFFAIAIVLCLIIIIVLAVIKNKKSH